MIDTQNKTWVHLKKIMVSEKKKKTDLKSKHAAGFHFYSLHEIMTEMENRLEVVRD